MSSEEIKNKIEIAKESVNGQEEPYKTEAFKIILSSLLGTTQSITKKTGNSTKRKSKPSAKKSTVSDIVYEMKTSLSDFAKKCTISEDELSETISIKKDVLEIVKRPKLKENEKHVQFGICILSGYKILYGIDWLPTLRLRKCLDNSGVGDLGHIFRSIDGTPLIVNRGSGSGKEYKITGKGIDTACELIHKLAKGEFKTK